MVEGIDRNQWVARMDEWGQAGQSFLFLISYDMQKVRLWRAQDIPATVRFQLPSHQRVGEGSELPERIHFRVHPPSRLCYERAFHRAQDEICAGNSYLLNLCARSDLETNLRLEDFFSHARAPYKLLIEGEFCCFSPEPFVMIRDHQIRSYPMKGTISAHLPDAQCILLEDEKECCEHATIVDLLRNDLARVSTQVHVPRYRYIEHVETAKGAIYQTSSEICGRLPQDWRSRLGQIFYQLLPAGSISGAPKKKTCEIIAEVEGLQRGFYTGVFGYYDGESVESAVCIRFVEQQGEDLCYKSGGGITAMSDCHAEYEEIVQKVYVPFTP